MCFDWIHQVAILDQSLYICTVWELVPNTYFWVYQSVSCKQLYKLYYLMVCHDLYNCSVHVCVSHLLKCLPSTLASMNCLGMESSPGDNVFTAVAIVMFVCLWIVPLRFRQRGYGIVSQTYLLSISSAYIQLSTASLSRVLKYDYLFAKVHYSLLMTLFGGRYIVCWANNALVCDANQSSLLVVLGHQQHYHI